MKHLSNHQLLEKIKDLVRHERHIQVEFLQHLLEVDSRKLFLEIGYGSLFDYVAKELGYSESAAYRRIQAMRLLRSVPEVEGKISNGEITLTTAAQVQSFIRMEAKRQGSVSVESKRELVAEVLSKSTREVEKVLISHSPEAALPLERVRVLTESHVEIRLIIDDKLQKKLDDLKSLLSHQNFDMNYADLIGLLADRELKRSKYKPSTVGIAMANSDFETKISRSAATPAPVLESRFELAMQPNFESEFAPELRRASRSRYISAAIRKAVWKRDNGCCVFVSNDGKICGSRYQIQFDHIQPFCQGGGHSVKNLRLLCANHNWNR